MYKKKRSSASRHKQPLLTATTVDQQPSQPPTPVVEQIDPNIKNAILWVVNALKSGEYVKALCFIKEPVSRYPLSGHLRHVEGLIHQCLAEKSDQDSYEKGVHLDDGVFSALLASELLPNSIRCASFVADLLYQLGPCHQQWDLVIQACQYALRIRTPTDYGLAEVFGEDVSDEARIADARREVMMWVQEDAERRKLEFAEKKVDEAVKKDSELYIKIVGMTMERRKKQSKAMMRTCNAFKLKMIETSKKKLDGDYEKMVEEYKGFWIRSLSAEKKRGFRKVNIEELEKHLKSLNCQMGMHHLSEAINFSKKAETLKFWVCYLCHEKFGDYASYRNHLREDHLNQKVWKLASDLELGSKTDMIFYCVWKPVDSVEATKIILNHTKSESSETSADDDHTTWVFCDDNERAEILVRIRDMLVFLMKRSCLASSHLCWMIEYTKDQFESTIPLSQFRIHGLDTPQIICCLDASKLMEILEFLRDVAHNCGFSEYGELCSSMDDMVSGDLFIERIHFSKDYSCFLWQESKGEPADNGSAIILPIECEDDVFSDSYDLLSWLNEESNYGEIVELWTFRRYIQNRQALKFFRMSEEALMLISRLCDGHTQLSMEFDAFREVGSMVVEAVEKMEKCPEDQTPHFLQLAKKRRQEIQEVDDYRARSEMNVLFKLLEASIGDRLDADQSGTQEISVEEDDWKKTDNAMKIALRRLKLQMLKDMCLVDAMILRITSALEKFEEQLTSISVYDYRSVIVPMMKSFLQTHLKNLYEDAKERSKAAEEALLAEMALEEAEKKIDRDSDNVKQKKKKKNKKNKAPEKAKKSESHIKDLSEDAQEKSKAAEEALLAEMALEAEKKINNASADMEQKKKNKNKNPETSKESEATEELIEPHRKGEEHNDNDSKNDDSPEEEDDDDRKQRGEEGTNA